MVQFEKFKETGSKIMLVKLFGHTSTVLMLRNERKTVQTKLVLSNFLFSVYNAFTMIYRGPHVSLVVLAANACAGA